MRFLLSLFCLVILFGADRAAADSFCEWRGERIVDGGQAHKSLKIVVASVPRTKYPGHMEERPWCVERYRVLGGFQELKIIETSQNGELKTKVYSIYYKGNKVGKDHFVIEMSWLGRSNDQRKATLLVDVDIVDAPF